MVMTKGNCRVRWCSLLLVFAGAIITSVGMAGEVASGGLKQTKPQSSTSASNTVTQAGTTEVTEPEVSKATSPQTVSAAAAVRQPQDTVPAAQGLGRALAVNPERLQLELTITSGQGQHLNELIDAARKHLATESPPVDGIAKWLGIVTAIIGIITSCLAFRKTKKELNPYFFIVGVALLSIGVAFFFSSLLNTVVVAVFAALFLLLAVLCSTAYVLNTLVGSVLPASVHEPRSRSG